MKTSCFMLMVFISSPFLNLSSLKATSIDPLNEVSAPGGYKLLDNWMKVHITAIRNSKTPSHHTRQLAYMGVALYESIVAGDPHYTPLANQLNGYTALPGTPDTKDFSWQASANAAMAETFRFFYSDNPVTLQRVDSMEEACIKQLRELGVGQKALTAGAEYGLKVARSVIEWSKSDNADKIEGPYKVPEGSGHYEPTPPKFISPIMPYMSKCRTMVKGSTENSIPPPPASFSEEPGSPLYIMADELYKSSLKKDESNIATALFWDDFPNGKSVTAGGHWESILSTVMAQLNLSLIGAASTYAALFITMQDAAIGCFTAKYTYNLIRPVTYIQKCMKHADWNPLIVTPPHPEYPAAHATVSMSAATILTHLLGDNIAFTDNTYAYLKYPPHHFHNFKEAGTEAGMSRFYGGIHYKPSIYAGYEQGKIIADNIAEKVVFGK